MSVEKYFYALKQKLEESGKDDFWAILKDDDGKGPMTIVKKKTKEAMKEYIKTNTDRYKNNLFAWLNIVFKSRLKVDELTEDDWIITVKIYVFEVSDEGDIDKTKSDSWFLAVTYTKDELDQHNLRTKDLIQMIRMVASRKIISDITGISFTRYNEKLQKILKKSKKSETKSGEVDVKIDSHKYHGTLTKD